MGRYFFKLGKPEIAESRYEFLQEIEPDHPYTKNLGQLLVSSGQH